MNDNLFLKEEIARAFENLKKEKEKIEGKKKIYSVMLFDTEMNLGVPGAKPNAWVNYHNRYFNNGAEALEYYANTPCPASQLIDAESRKELEEKMDEMIQNFENEQWLQTQLYPTL